MRQLMTDPVNGISETSDEFKDRITYFGTNERPEIKIKSLWTLILECFEDKILRILLLAALVSLIVGMIKEGVKEGWLEGVTIYIAVILIVSVTSGNNYMK